MPAAAAPGAGFRCRKRKKKKKIESAEEKALGSSLRVTVNPTFKVPPTVAHFCREELDVSPLTPLVHIYRTGALLLFSFFFLFPL